MEVQLTEENKITVSKYLVSRIEETGVDIVPVIQGSAIMKVIDEVGQSKKLKYICPNHEQGLAIMVDAYARIKGFGVGMVTSGPGGINAGTGIACAYYDSIPCMFITGNVGVFHAKGARGVRQRGFQESDMVSILKPITKYATYLDNPENVRYEFEKALYLAKSGRPGPVAIDLPYNVQRAMVDPATLKGFTPPKEATADEKNISKAVFETLETLKNARHPALLIGGGVRIADQIGLVNELVALLKIPTVTTWGAIDVFESTHPYYLGNIGRSGNPSAVQWVQNSDVMLSLGARFTTKETIDEKAFAKNTKIISVDIDRSELEEGLIDPKIKINVDLKEFLPALIKEIKAKNFILSAADSFVSEADKLKQAHYRVDATRKDELDKYISPYHFGEALSRVMTEKDILLSDVGVNLTWMAQSFKIKKGQRFISAWGCSPMGYAFPAAIGACLADKNADVVAVIGDGGMSMNIQELQTVVHNNLPVKIFVLNNKCYASIRVAIKQIFEGRTFATDAENGYSPPDFVKIATAYGISSFKILPSDNLEEKIKQALSMPGPVLVEIPTDREQSVFDNAIL